MHGEVWRRAKPLVAWLVGEVIDAGEEGVRLPDLVAMGVEVGENSGRRPWSAKTVENTVRDLAAFGAVRLVHRGRDRIVEATLLGLAWQARRLLPPVADLGDLHEAVLDVVDWFYDEGPEPCEDWSPAPVGAAELAEAVDVDLETPGTWQDNLARPPDT